MSVAANVAELEARIKAVEEGLKPFLEQGFEEAVADLDEEEVARLNIVLSFAMTSLFYIFLRAQGISAAKHPVKKELARVQSYIGKLKSASEAHKLAKSNSQAASKLLENVAADVEAVEVASPPARVVERVDSKKRSAREGGEGGAANEEEVKKKKKKKKKKSKKEKKQ
jgi:exosome complex protein LRP1